MVLGTLGARLLGWSYNNKIRTKNNQRWLWILKICEQKFLIRPHPVTTLEIKKYYQKEPKFNGVYSRDFLPDKIKDGHM